MQWFVLRVASNKEERVREALDRKMQVEAVEGVGDQVGEDPQKAEGDPRHQRSGDGQQTASTRHRTVLPLTPEKYPTEFALRRESEGPRGNRRPAVGFQADPSGPTPHL